MQDRDVNRVVAAKEAARNRIAIGQADVQVAVALNHMAGGDDDPVGRPDDAARAQAAPAFDSNNPGVHAVAREFGVATLPTMFLIDKKGKVRHVKAQQENLDEVITKLLAE